MPAQWLDLGNGMLDRRPQVLAPQTPGYPATAYACQCHMCAIDMGGARAKGAAICMTDSMQHRW